MINTIDFNKLRASITTGGDLVDELRKVQQSKYDLEDKAILSALSYTDANKSEM
jgi:hypothetical protein